MGTVARQSCVPYEADWVADIVEHGGVALPKDDLTAWVKEIKRLEDTDYYNKVQARGAEWLDRWRTREPYAILRIFQEFT